MPYKDPEKRKANKKAYYEENKVNKKAYQKARYDAIMESALASIACKKIKDIGQWKRFCQIKRGSVRKFPFSDDFTDETMFEKLVLKCYYCGDPATELDRIDSSLGHTTENCVGSCRGCNNSKGNGCTKTFLDRAFYRVFGTYYSEDEDIWADNKHEPSYGVYKWSSKKKGVPFELSKEQFYKLVTKQKCEYCRRTPEWVGVDRVVPERGYVESNVVPCCNDCNLDKHEDTWEITWERNVRIAECMLACVFDKVDGVKVIRNRGDGGKKKCKKVCANRKLYPSAGGASSALGKNEGYVANCISHGTRDDMFYVSDAFYEKYVGAEGITRSMYESFE